MSSINCSLKEIIKIRENEFWLVEDVDDKIEYTIPIAEFAGLKVSKGLTYSFNKQFNKTSRRYFLTPLENDNYKIGEIYDFEIVDFEINESIPGQEQYKINVKDLKDNIIGVNSFQWQTIKSWKHPSLKCEVYSFRNQIPILTNRDTRHPLFEIGKTYEFTVKGVTKKISTFSEKESLFFQLKGLDGCDYLTPILPIQEVNFVKLDKVTCEVIILRNQLKLKQVAVNDIFYVDVNQIINDKALIRKYFEPIINGASETADEKKFKQQYESESAFWIFTYCNKILPQKFYDYITRLDYKNALQVNDLIITFEEWIIRKGIIKSFSKVTSRKEASKKAEFQLEKSRIIKKILNLFLEKEYYSIIKNSDYTEKLTTAELYYMFRFSDIYSVDETFFIRKFESINSTSKEAISERFYLILFESQISFNKSKFLSRDTNEEFNLINHSSSNFKNKAQQDKHFNWSYLHYLICDIIGETKKANLIMATMLREYFYVEHSLDIRQSLIQHAFSILKNVELPPSEKYFEFNGSLEISKKFRQLNSNHINYKEPDWNLLNRAYKSQQHILVNIVNKSAFGFDIVFNDIAGFLPYHEVSSNELRKYEFEEIDFTITAKCTLLCEDFNFFVATQLANDDESFSVKNNKISDLKEGAICDAYTRNYKDFGVFVSTIFGQGLLHINNISPHIWDESRLKKHFRKSKAFKVQVENSDVNGKLSFSLKGLLESDFKADYIDFLDRVDNDHLITYELEDSDDGTEDKAMQLNTSVQYQKARCFEQYAILQLNLHSKMDLLFLAKQFHSSVNSARSYLLNIFIQYFQILVLVGKTIENYSSDALISVKMEAQKMKSTIDLKTLNTFPDTDKLVYFLDILLLFNEKSDESMNTLFEYIKEYSIGTPNSSLKTVAKIALSNNLMISETTEESDFSLKNLKIINSYLNSGILTLQETESDKLQRELKENVKYWRGLIKEDEGQNLEFKQTFLVPIIDVAKDEYLKSLFKNEYEHVINKKRKAIKHSAFKTLCAFANTNGGTLLIGVSDKKVITGLEIDFNSLKESDRDGFGKRFDDEVKVYFGESFSHLLDKSFLRFDEGDVLIVKVTPSSEEIFMLRDEEGRESEELYIRKLSSSEQLKGRELAKFIKRKQLEMLKTNIES